MKGSSEIRLPNVGRWRAPGGGGSVLPLAGILVVGALFRLWRLTSLVNAVHDYDPGAHAMAGRFIAQGLLPYRDFISVHPPLYDLTLAAVFKVFGYDFYYVSYLSVLFSLASIVLVYMIGKHLYSRRAGLVAAGLFAVEPLMVYFGRRGVQESMGFFLVLLAALLACRYVEERRLRTLLGCGLALGLAISVKYVFVPVVAGIGLGVLVLSLPQEMWHSVRRLGSLRFWSAYLLLAAVAYALVLFLRHVVDIPVPVPFWDMLLARPQAGTVVLLVFGVPFLILWRHWMRPGPIVEWFRAAWHAIRLNRLWALPAAAAFSFLLVSGYFLIAMPADFLQQTVAWQMGRSTTEVPSLVGLVRLSFISAPLFRLSLLSVAVLVPLCLVLLNRREFTRGDCFLAVMLGTALVLSQGFYQLPRYYAAPLMFGLAAWAGLTVGRGSDAPKWSGLGVTAASTVLALAFVSTTSLLLNYSGYDIACLGMPSKAALYETTNRYLEDVGAKKVFSTNPIYPALSDSYESPAEFDSYALWFLRSGSTARLMDELDQQGVDYVLVDSWAWFWGTPPESEIVADFVEEIRMGGSLVALIEPDSRDRVEVYRLDRAPDELVNGDFTYWSDYQRMQIPIGWNPILIGGAGDSADIRQSGELTYEGVRLVAYEDGFSEAGSSATHAGLSRRLAFPRTEVSTVVMPDVNTEALGAEPLGPAIHFLDGEGHSVILGFSDEVEEEQVSVCGECGHVAVIQPAPLHRWSEHSIDVAKYWKMGGWDIPDELTVLVVLSAHSDYPGYYTFHVASVECSQSR